MTKQEVAQIVEPYFRDERLGDIYFVVDRERIGEMNGWIHVPIRASHLPKRLSHLFNLLADINEEIVDKENLKIVLTSGEPLVEDEETQGIAV